MNWEQGFQLLFSEGTLAFMMGGTIIGLFLGSLPGLGPVFVLTLLLSLTLHTSAEDALVMLVAGYTSAVFGGAISSVLFKVPGHPGNIATTFDGPALAQRGRAGEAVVAIGVAGCIGGLLGSAFVIFVSPLVAKIVLSFQPVDYFMFAMCGLSLVAALSRGRLLAGLMLGGLGIMISTIGPDIETGAYRFTFNIGFLQNNGIPIALVAVGVFAVGSALVLIEENWRTGNSYIEKVPIGNTLGKGVMAVLSRPLSIARAVVVGIVMGVIPGLGITASNVSAYYLERWVRRRSDWKDISIIGVITPEAADNSTLIAELLPALTLGIPGAATSAIILAALALHGIQTGPGFFSSTSPVTAGMLLAMPLSQLFMLVFGLLLLPIIVAAAKIPRQLLGPCIIVIASVGAFADLELNSDIIVVAIFGIIGYAILKLHLPLAPLVMGTVLGPLAEENFDRVQILDKATGHIAYLQPLALALGVIAAIVLIGSLVVTLYNNRIAAERR